LVVYDYGSDGVSGVGVVKYKESIIIGVGYQFSLRCRISERTVFPDKAHVDFVVSESANIW